MANQGRTSLLAGLIRRACLFCGLMLALTSCLSAAEPTPQQDDATLRDVTLLGEKLAWVVGDHGVVWKTTDGGMTWQFVSVPVRAHWSSVCFLSDRVGWIAGGDTEPFTRRGRGLLLVTKDGGATWQSVSQAELPRLRYVRFFDSRQGVIVGEPSSSHPSGVLFTEDAGQSWREMPGQAGSSWLAADFMGPSDGLLGGRQGRVAAVADGQALPARVDSSSWRRVHSVRLQRDLKGWLVGDGGLVMKTETGGVVWEVPAGELPRELRDAANLRAVACRGDQVWIAGSPGGVIWHSPDGGQTWQRQLTGSSLPIESLEFAQRSPSAPRERPIARSTLDGSTASDARSSLSRNEMATFGIAVGACGVILRTDDGGATWHVARGVGRRAAWLSVSVWPDEISLRLMAQQSGEQSYRSIATVLVPESPRDDRRSMLTAESDQRLLDAVLASGGNSAETDDRWLTAMPDLYRQPEKLLEAWSRRAEGRLDEQWLARLVVTLRTWRPDVVVVGGETDDAVQRHLRESVLRAIDMAADPTQAPWLTEVFGLPAWKVSKAYVRRPDGSAGDATLEPHELLARLGLSIAQAAAPAEGRLLVEGGGLRTQREAYRLLRDETTAGGSFWRGMAHAPGSAARRKLIDLDERDLEERQKQARRQKNFAASVERALDDETRSSALLAELRGHSRALPPSQAAIELAQLAADLQRHAHSDLAEATLIELIDRYGGEPAAHTAMADLIRTWCSAEISWRRIRKTEVVQNKTKSREPGSGVQNSKLADGKLSAVTTDRQPILNFERLTSDRASLERLQTIAAQKEVLSIEAPLTTGATMETTRGSLQIGREATWDRGQLDHWQQQALRLAQRLRERSPELADQPSVQFPLAAMLRQRGSPDLSAAIYRRFGQSVVATPWQRVAQRELWLQTPIGEQPEDWLRSVPTRTKPHLDGVLTDDCWQSARHLVLHDSDPTASGRGQAPQNSELAEEGVRVQESRRSPILNSAMPDPSRAFVMLAHDERYLYVAASLPRHPDLPEAEPMRDGRTHDADLTGFDRVTLLVDIDRDYAVSDVFEIDERGCTRESCGSDFTWNPKWFVATSSDLSRWTFEAAIPLSEIAPPELRRGCVWSIGIVRTLPAISVSGWPASGNQPAEPVWRGLLKLE